MSGMILRVCWIYFLSLSLSEGRAGNITGDADEDTHNLERNESNVTLKVIFTDLDESLPSAEPLVGTYPHDFSMTLPSVSRRSYKQPSNSGYSFEQQGNVI